MTFVSNSSVAGLSIFLWRQAMETSLVIRRAKPSDARELAALSAELGYPATPTEMKDRLEGVCLRPANGVFVAEGGAVVGWLHVSLIESLESDAFAEIRGLVVTESRRGSGIGTQLVAAAEAWAAAKGCNRIRVRTNIIRTETQEFYKKLGYASKKRQEVFDKSLPRLRPKPG
jgi:GNAT superfamily N-acetyltransferase